MHRQLLDYLTPMLGATTAENLLKHYCGRMKMSAEEISAEQVPALADAMRPMLAVWLGSAGAIRVAQELAQLGEERRQR